MSYQDIYRQAIANGCSPLFADMLASRQAPGSLTDREFFIDRTNGDETPRMRQMAKRLYGFTPGPSDVYVPGLARKGMPMDPQAWISPSGGRGQVKKVCEQNGWGCDGQVKVQGREAPPPKRKKLADNIVDKIVKRNIRQDPSLASKPLGELREQAIEQHGPKR